MINFVTWQSEFDTFDIIWDRDKSIRCVGLRVGEYMSFQNHETLTLGDAFDVAEQKIMPNKKKDIIPDIDFQDDQDCGIIEDNMKGESQ